MADQNVMGTHPAERRNGERERRAEQFGGLPLVQQIELLRGLVRRSLGLCRMTAAVLSLPVEERSGVPQIAKAIEVAWEIVHEAESLCRDRPTESPLAQLSVVVDQAEGILATVDAWLWSSGWRDVPDDTAVHASLDAVVEILAFCEETLAGLGQTSVDRATTH